MRLLFIIRLALINSLNRRLRTSLTISGIAVSVAVIVLLTGIGSGLQRLVTEEIANSGSQSAISVSSKRTKQLKLDQSTLSKLRSISGVSQVEQLVGLSGRITYHGISLDLPIYATTPGYLEVTPMEIRHGQAFTTQSQADLPLIISPVALTALGIEQPDQAVGKELAVQLDLPKDFAANQEEDIVQIEQPDYTIAAVVDKGSMPVAYLPLELLEKNGLTSVAEVKLVVADASRITTVRETVEQLGFQTSSIHDTIEQVNRIFGVIQIILLVFGLVTLAIAVFGTLNTITIALVEQTRQVGFLRILGVRKQDVGRLFIVQSILLSFGGVGLGVVIGVGLGWLTNLVILYLASRNGITGIAIYEAPILPILLMLACSIGLGWVLGLGPARRAITMQPLTAIRA